MSYPFKEIEPAWQAYWEKNKTFRTPGDRERPKYYVLDMFPYPSGAGLHVGHPEGYTATDIMARYKRCRGYNVLHPIGWDAFGLPAERYAMQTGIHPAKTTEENINNFRRQLKMLGFSYDWEREVSTTDPKYYRWTQWIFLQLFNSYFNEKKKKAEPIEKLKVPKKISENKKKKQQYIDDHRLAYVTLAPVNWCAELGTVLANEEVEEWVSKGYTVERRPMRQWMLRITAYAERLLEDLKEVDWPRGTLELQRNWIGRSEGAEIDFSVSTERVSRALKGTKPKTTRRKLRVFTTRPDTLFGVTYMVLAPEHPFVSEIVSDEQREAVEEYIKQASLKSERDRAAQGDKTEKTGVFLGAHAVHPFTKEQIPIWISDYVMMGYGTGAIMAVPAHDERDFAFAKAFDLPIRRVIRSEEETEADANTALEAAFTEDGINMNSQMLDGKKTPEAIQTMIDHLEEKKLGKRRINYKLRDWLFSRQRYWGEPIPISFDKDDNFVALSEEDLPLLLPESNNFQPAETGESPLANLTDWVNYKDKSDRKLRRETNTMPQWAGSCWYYLRYIDPENKKRLVGKEKEGYWMDGGVDLYVGGAEHAVLHLLYARFWHKVLYDLGHVSTNEPFKKLVHQGIILGEDGEKMSKSRGNVVNPDAVVGEHGADAFRLFEMFMGPLEQQKPWSGKGIEGVSRFLSRAWRLFVETEDGSESKGIDPRTLAEPEAANLKKADFVIHSTIQKVTEDIERMSFNTAISQLMIFVNEFFATRAMGRFGCESFVILLSPFAPHVAEELWSRLGHTESIAYAPWPTYEAAKTVVDEIEVVFQVNGKLRGKASVARGISDDELRELALADPGVVRILEGKEPRKVIVVKGKLVNIVA